MSLDRVRQLRALYAEVPDVRCQGLCTSECVARIEVSDTEHARLAVRREDATILFSMRYPPREPCALLTEDGSCSVYNLRPMVCRLWGAVESLACPHGCRPESGDLLTDRQAMELLIRSYEIGGGGPAARPGALTVDDVRQLLDIPEVAPLAMEVMRGDYSNAERLQQLVYQYAQKRSGLQS